MLALLPVLGRMETLGTVPTQVMFYHLSVIQNKKLGIIANRAYKNGRESPYKSTISMSFRSRPFATKALRLLILTLKALRHDFVLSHLRRKSRVWTHNK